MEWNRGSRHVYGFIDEVFKTQVLPVMFKIQTKTEQQQQQHE